jgi:hypothetical protein
MTTCRVKALRFVFALAALCVSAAAQAAWDQPFLDTLGGGDSLRASGESFASVTTVVWAVKAASVVASTFLLVFTARRLHEDDYQGALWSFAASIIAGASPFIAETLFLA